MTGTASRWKQRFENFEKAFLFFKDAVEKPDYTPIEIAGLVQAFEFTFELGWKTMKDYLYEQGTDAKFPRESIQEAFKGGIIANGHVWIEMLEKRNEFSHTYDAQNASLAVETIKYAYYKEINQVYTYFKNAY